MFQLQITTELLLKAEGRFAAAAAPPQHPEGHLSMCQKQANLTLGQGSPQKMGLFVSICLFIVRLRALRATLGHQLPWGNILGHMVLARTPWGHSPKCLPGGVEVPPAEIGRAEW